MVSIFPANPEINDVYVTSASVAYVYNGEAWVKGQYQQDLNLLIDSKIAMANIDGGEI